jgi:hypothetical protein
MHVHEMLFVLLSLRWGSSWCRTSGNINDRTDKDRYWAHAFVCVIISCLVYGLVWYLRKYLIACKVCS